MAHTTQPPIRDTALRTAAAFLVVIGGVLTLLFLYAVRRVVLLLVVALILSIALSPLQRFIVKRGLKRVGASVVTVFITLLVLLGIIGAIASPLITQGDSLVQSGPHIIDQATSSGPVRALDRRFHFINKAKDLSKEAPKLLTNHSAPLISAVGTVFSAISDTVVVLVLTLFMLMEGQTAWSQFVRLLGRNQGRFTETVGKKIVTAVGGYVNGNLFISLIAGIVSLATMLIAGVPYAFALAALVAVFDLIPLVGAAFATIFVGLVALTQGVVTAIIVVAVLLIYQFLEGHLIQPVVYGKSVQLSQLLIVIASLIGALLGGIIGVLLAIPVAASVQIIIVELLRASGADIEPDINTSVKK